MLIAGALWLTLLVEVTPNSNQNHAFSPSFQSGMLGPKWDFDLTFFTQALARLKATCSPSESGLPFCLRLPSCPVLRWRGKQLWIRLNGLLLSEMIWLTLLVRITGQCCTEWRFICLYICWSCYCILLGTTAIAATGILCGVHTFEELEILWQC